MALDDDPLQATMERHGHTMPKASLASEGQDGIVFSSSQPTSQEDPYNHHFRNVSNLTYASDTPIELPSVERHDFFEDIPSPAAHDRDSSWKRASIVRVSSKKHSKQHRAHSPYVVPPSMSFTSDETYETEDTAATSLMLGPLQAKERHDHLAPLDDVDDDPSSFDLVAPPSQADYNGYSLEKRSEQLFSREHLLIIFAEPTMLLKFTSFLSKYRPNSVQVLIYYLDALKAMKAVAYSNAVADALEPLPGHAFTETNPMKTVNKMLQEKADKAFDILVQEDLPAYITHMYIHVVSESITRRITGTLPPHLREASEGLAEVFCLTDPSRPDNPIVFASEEFHRMTQYGVDYAIGRNCRFLQGPKTSPHSSRRLKEACMKGKEHYEVFLNYRRDGSQFLNLLMISPLCDSRGAIRYFIGAQVDVSGLARDCTDMESLQRLVEQLNTTTPRPGAHSEAAPPHLAPHKDEFQALAEMFNASELSTVRQHGGRMHSPTVDPIGDGHSTSEAGTRASDRPRLLLAENSDPEMDPTPFRSQNGAGAAAAAAAASLSTSGRLAGPYTHYLLVRPAPSLRILFASPSLRVPGILQSSFLERIGGSPRVREELDHALAEGRGVTAKVRWLSRFNEGEGRSRWIHCTPLLGNNGNVGVWMVVLVDPSEGSGGVGGAAQRRWRVAPPVGRVGGFADGLRGEGARGAMGASVENLRRDRREYEGSLSGASGHSVTLR